MLKKLAAAVQMITDRPVLSGARFGIAVHDVADGALIYGHNAHEIFPGASTTKIPTCAYALALLGPDFRFRTRLVRCGRLDSAGTLHGDLILVASGDPNLSGRVSPDDTLEFRNLDHSNSAGPQTQLVERDPLQTMQFFARAAREAGIRRITGTVLVDTQLFSEGYREPGTDTTVSPVAVNDNLIDVEVVGAARPGEAVSYRTYPASGYVRFLDRMVTVDRAGESTLQFSGEQREVDGTSTVVISGTVPAGVATKHSFPVESPSRFARTTLVEALSGAGVIIEGALFGSSVTSVATPPNAAVVAEHVSPPLVETTKVILKVSQNLHAEMLIPLIGATVRGVKGAGARAAGYAACAELLARWGVDPTGVFQRDACGAHGYFSPDFMCRLLVRIASSEIYDAILYGFPIMGRDGTLWDIQPQSSAAGHVSAKTGTLGYADFLHKATLFTCKGLAGYISSRSGGHLAFTIYLNNFWRPCSSAVDPGQVLGELATALYEHL